MAESIDRKLQAMEKFEAEVKSKTGEDVPEELRSILWSAKKLIRLFDHLSRERGVGEGTSLVYPEEFLDAVRLMYPDGVKKYTPRAGKRQRLYDVSLEELVHGYKRPPSPEF